MVNTKTFYFEAGLDSYKAAREKNKARRMASVYGISHISATEK
jgi:hypothetical protein